MAYTYKYPRPAVTVDAVVFRIQNNHTEVLLIQRGRPPYKGSWALPGGFVDMDETLEEAIARELKEETNLSEMELRQLMAFSAPGRDPRGRTISVVFWGIMKNARKIKAGDDAQNAKWFDLKDLPGLAFDHREIIETAISELNTSDKALNP